MLLFNFNIFLLGKKCVTEHENFKSIVLLKDVLWTAFVNMHDRESSALPKKRKLPMKTYRYAAYRHIAQQGVRKTRKLAIYARKINLRE